MGKSIGLKTSTANADYINLYHGNAALLMESLELVQQTAAVILAAIQPEPPAPQEPPPTTAAETAPESRRTRRSSNHSAVTETHEAFAEVA